MKTSKAIVIGALVSGGAVAAYVGVPHAAEKAGAAPGKGASTRSAAASTSASPLGCDLHDGDRLGFYLEEKSSYAVSAQQAIGAGQSAARPSREARILRGEVLLRVLDEAPVDGARTVAAIIDRPEVSVSGARSSDIESELGKPVFFRMDRACKIKGFAQGEKLSAATSNLWKLTLKMTETVIPAPGTQRAWKVEQSDPTGTFLSSYTRKDRDGAAELRRVRGTYQSLHHDAGGVVTAEVRKAEAVAHATPGQAWINDLRVSEHVVLKAHGSVVADVDTALTLARRDVADHPSGFFSRALSAKGLTFTSADALEQPPPALPYADREPLKGLHDMTSASVLADVAQKLAIQPQGDFDGAVNLLVQYIRLDPKNARALVDRARRGDIDDGAKSVMWLGIGLAGGREAHTVLADALGDRRLGELDRQRAMVALAGVPDPDRAVTDALLNTRGATLALGSLAHNPALPAEEKQRIVGSLSADLDRASTVESRVSALTALGNAGDSAAKERVAALTGNEDPVVSAAAYRALKSMDSLPASGELLDAFAKSTDPRQQSAIAEALGAVKLDDAGVTRAIGMLESESRPGVRATLVSMLGAASAENPAAKSALVALLRVEKEPAILTLLGRFVRPSDMN